MIRRVSICAVAFLLGACSGDSPPPTAPPVDQRFGAPVVAEPRDIRPFAENPCAGPLTPSDWRGLGFSSQGGVEILGTGEKLCDRQGPSNERAVSLIVTPARDVLVDTYRVRQFALFRSMTIGGLPATIEQSSSDSVSCSVTVGTAEGQGFIVNYSEYESSSGASGAPCVRGQQVAERVVGALPRATSK